MEIREATHADIEGILELVNGVFCRSNNKPETMGSQFPYLFSDENAKNLWIAVEHDKVVSHVGFFSTKAVIEGIPVTISSIGSVATDPLYRNQGLSTQLLEKALRSMKAQQTDIVLVSGTRGLYKRNGYYSVGKTHRYVSTNITADYKNTDYLLRLVPKEEIFETAFAEQLIDLENNEETRFVRSVDEFKTLFSASGYCRIFPWRQELYQIEQDGVMTAYFIVGFEPKNGRETAHVIEFHGNREVVAEGFLQLAAQPLTDVVIPVLDHERMLSKTLIDLGFENQETHTYPGTIKLPNPLLFWSKFKSQLIDSNQKTDLLEVGNGEGYQLHINGERVFEGSEAEFAQWLFLRLPLPWPNGLNYI